MKNKDILFVSAFYNINRENWKNKHSRSVINYFESFKFLAKHIDYDLVVYVENRYLHELKDLNKKNIIIKDLDLIKKDLFITKYKNIEEKIINSDSYKQFLTKKTKNKPEHNYALYNLINHDKVNFVNHSKKIMKDYKYYGWLDFGFCKEKNVNDIDRIPKNINFNYLHKNKILYQSLVKKINHKSSLFMLGTDEIYIQGTFWIVSSNYVELYKKIYELELLRWYKAGIVDDDQNLVFQLIFKYPQYFDLYYSKNFFSLFKIILNKPLKTKIIKNNT